MNRRKLQLLTSKKKSRREPRLQKGGPLCKASRDFHAPSLPIFFAFSNFELRYKNNSCIEIREKKDIIVGRNAGQRHVSSDLLCVWNRKITRMIDEIKLEFSISLF